MPGSPVAVIFQLLLPSYGLLVGKVVGKTWLLGDPGGVTKPQPGVQISFELGGEGGEPGALGTPGAESQGGPIVSPKRGVSNWGLFKDPVKMGP